MRKRQTFLLTILTTETEGASFCGRLKVIATGKTCTFTSLDELHRLIISEMGEDMLEQLHPQTHNPDSLDPTASIP